MDKHILIFYLILLQVVFKDYRFIISALNVDIPDDLSSKEDIILKTKDGDLIYFKIQNRDFNNKFFKLLDFCYNLKEKYCCNVDLYILCKANVDVNSFERIIDSKINFEIGSCSNVDGDIMLDILKEKLNNDEPFTNLDTISTILLPFMGSYDLETFQLAVHKFLLDLKRKCNY